MARRRVANLMALAVLATVTTKPMHPYEIASVLRARGKDRDLPVKWGSLYRVVQNLARHGLLRAVHSERQGGRPERTVYAITDDGRAELVDWVRELIGRPTRDPADYRAGLSVLAALPPDEVADLLTRRVEALDQRIADDRAQLARDAADGLPRLFLVESEYDLAVQAAELAWTRALLAELTAGTMPDLDQWRAYHRTGQIPPELAELAERGTDPDQ